MNRIAILLIVLLVAALGILLLLRAEAVAPDPLEQVDRLIGQARDGAAATEQARALLRAIIDNSPAPEPALAARRRLAELELLLGNPQAASDQLLGAITAHPGSPEVPRLLFELALLLHGELDRPAEAREVLRRVVHLYPLDPLAAEARRLVELTTTATTEGDTP